MDIVDKIYMTSILNHFEGDTFFPDFIKMGGWQMTDAFKEMCGKIGERFYYHTYEKIGKII